MLAVFFETLLFPVLHYSLFVSATIAMEAVRKMEKVRRLVIVTEMFKSRFSLIAALCNPSRQNGMGNPFFPVRAVPVDTMPNAGGYMLMILMERIGLHCLPRSLGLSEAHPAIHLTEDPDNYRAADILIPNRKVAKETRLGQGDARLTIISRREERELLQQREKKNLFTASRRRKFAGHEYQPGRNFKRPYSDDESSAMEEYDIRDLKAEEQRRWIEEESIRQMEDEEHMIQIEEEKQRKRREKDEQRRLMEEHKKWVEEKEHHRQMEEKELNRQMEEKEFRRKMEEKEFRRQVEEKELKRQMEQKELKRRVDDQREREMMRTGLNLRNGNDMVHDLIADSLREVSIPQLSEGTAQKLKQLIAEAVKSMGTSEQGERRSVVSTSTGFGGIRPENITVSRFGRPDKETPESRHFEEGHSRHITGVDNPYERRYAEHGGALRRSERYEDKLMPQSGCLEEGYSQSIMKVNSLYQHGFNAYEGPVGRDSYQHYQTPQYSVYGMKEVPIGQTGVDRAGIQPPKLRDSSSVCSNSVQCLEGGGETYMRNVYHSDVNPSQKQEQGFSQSLESYTRHSHFSGDYAKNEHQPLQDWTPSLHSAVEQGTDSYARLIALNRSLANVATSYVPLSNTRKYTACSTPKPPGTEDVNHPEGSRYFYEDTAPQITNSSHWQGDNGTSYLALEVNSSSQSYRNRMQDGQGWDRTQHTRYFM